MNMKVNEAVIQLFLCTNIIPLMTLISLNSPQSEVEPTY